MHRSYTGNRKALNRIGDYLRIAICLLTVEMVLWVISISSPL